MTLKVRSLLLSLALATASALAAASTPLLPHAFATDHDDALFAESSTGISDPDFMTSDELDRWIRVQEEMQEFGSLLRLRIAGFGGVYRDAEGTIVLLATSEHLDEARDTISFAPADADVRVVE